MELGRDDLIPTLALDDDIIDSEESWGHENIESLKRIERNRIVRPLLHSSFFAPQN